MARLPERVRIEEIDWQNALPFTRLFRCFWIAVWPPTKLMLALAMIVVIYIGGQLFSGIAGRQVLPGEITEFAQRDSESFGQWLSDEDDRQIRRLKLEVDAFALTGTDDEQSHHDAALQSSRRFGYSRDLVGAHFAKRDDETAADDRDALLSRINTIETERSGIFQAAFQYEMDAFNRLITSAFRLRFGFDGLVPDHAVQRESVIGALHDLAVVLPSWFLAEHPIFLTILCLYILVVWSWLGGAISRLAALDCTEPPGMRIEAATISVAMGFVRQRWVSYFTAPLLPLIVALLFGVLIAIIGLLFNVPLLNIIAGLLFGLLLILGFVSAMMLLLLSAGSGLLYPAIAIEGTDAFQALANAGNYLFGRFWRWVFYNLVALVFGAIAYLILAFVILLTLDVTFYFAKAFVFTQSGIETFDAMVSSPATLTGDESAAGQLGTTHTATAMLVTGVWVNLCYALLGAFAISYYFTAQTWIYLLLRRSADGTEYDDIFLDADDLSPAMPVAPPPGS